MSDSSLSTEPPPSERAALTIELLGEGVFVLRFGVERLAANGTSPASFVRELPERLAALAQDATLEAVVLVTPNSARFVAGFDIAGLRAFDRAEEASEWARTGQRALAALADFPVPVVAAIQGECLGFGLELALACRARVAATGGETKLGFPEVHWGVLPGLGGTERLPRLLGLNDALDLLLTGRPIDGPRALALGLIDDLVDVSVLLEVAADLARSRARVEFAPPSRAQRILGRAELALVENPLRRAIVFEQAKKRRLGNARPHHLAPERILDVVRVGMNEGSERALALEALAFGELVVSAEARALMHVSRAREQADDHSAVAPVVEARSVNRIAVLGAGPAGSDVAYASAALAQVEVRLKDLEDAALGETLKRVRGRLDERVASRELAATERDRAMARLTATTDYSGFGAIDLIYEAASEDLSLKQTLLAEVEHSAHASAIFASSSACFSIAKLVEQARRPEHVIAMSYFSPFGETPLLEVAVSPRTAPAVTATCVAFGKRQGKTVIVVGDGPGFYVSRISSRYSSEAAFFVAEGVPVEQVDAALIDWGFAAGPIGHMDEVGIDLAIKVNQTLHEAFGERMPLTPLLQTLLDDRRLGVKNQRGFYRYGAGPIPIQAADANVVALLGAKPALAMPSAEIARRSALAMINEAAHCFGEGILRCASDGDVGAILGLGFPAFRGGPFYYADALGALELVATLKAYEPKFGARFAPAPVLEEMARTGASFYGRHAVAPGQHRV